MIPCKSSFVTGYEYRAASSELAVQMHGKVYVYGAVPADVAERFAAASSKGEAFKEIKANYAVKAPAGAAVDAAPEKLNLAGAELSKLVNMTPAQRAAYLDNKPVASVVTVAPSKVAPAKAPAAAVRRAPRKAEIVMAPIPTARRPAAAPLWRPIGWNSATWGDPVC